MSKDSLPFYKYEGAGNDFILFDCFERPFLLDAEQIRQLCSRRFGVGADGVLCVTSSRAADFKMSYFNADGNEVAMCGNGLRCAIDFVHRRLSKDSYRIETKAGLQQANITATGITTSIHPVASLFQAERFILDGMSFLGYGVCACVPHLVFFVPDIADLPVTKWGKELRFSARFAPEGTNVNFVMRKEDALYVRTYERGVEEETLSCTTGCVAASFVAKELWSLKGIIEVVPLSNQPFHVAFTNPIMVGGRVNLVFRGEVSL